MGKNTLAAHCIHINPAEIDIIKETETMVVHNPESNMGNAVGCGSVVEMFKRGILIGLGTDGFTHDMTESLKVGNIIHKHNLCDPKAGGIEIPAMLFENNRKIVSRFFKRPTGIIKEGACADIIICDYDPLTPMNENNLNGHILFGMNGKNVVTTIANGKVLMKDRKVLCIDEKEVFAKCRELAKKLWNRINA
jgi:cytosine/adenosine deaminase-related metal-dependent hydrolase